MREGRLESEQARVWGRHSVGVARLRVPSPAGRAVGTSTRQAGRGPSGCCAAAGRGAPCSSYRSPGPNWGKQWGMPPEMGLERSNTASGRMYSTAGRGRGSQAREHVRYCRRRQGKPAQGALRAAALPRAACCMSTSAGTLVQLAGQGWPHEVTVSNTSPVPRNAARLRALHGSACRGAAGAAAGALQAAPGGAPAHPPCPQPSSRRSRSRQTE